VNCNILHRDISENNIIITKPDVADGFKGMLIDFDLAKNLESDRSGAQQQTGTVQFMAIQVLQNADHTYRHDLESFFYVLIWMCACRSWNNGFDHGEERPKQSSLYKWEIGELRDIAQAKLAHMTDNGFEEYILPDFPSSLNNIKPLCQKIRSILFGVSARNVGTPLGEPSLLYDQIIAAYDETISELK
jgi:serine/threonine protein kinase